MKHIFLGLVLIVLIASTVASDGELANSFDNSYQVYEIEKSGIKYFESEEYAKAFESLDVSSKQGLKNSQHYLGIMYLKGLHVPASLEMGMGWLGVANEVDNEEWSTLYSKIYERLKEAEQATVNTKVDELTSLYGLKAQGISCRKHRSIMSRRTTLQCQKKNERGMWITR